MIDNHAELVAAVLSYAHRPELADEVADLFIPLANARLGRELRDATNTIVLPIDPPPPENPIELPEDVAEIFSVQFLQARGPITLMSAAAHGINQLGTVGQPPAIYQLIDGALDVRPFITGSYVVTYYSRPVLTAEDDQNATLSTHPSLYLNGALLELHLWAQDMELAQTMGGLFGREIEAVNKSYQRSRFDAPAMRGV